MVKIFYLAVDELGNWWSAEVSFYGAVLQYIYEKKKEAFQGKLP